MVATKKNKSPTTKKLGHKPRQSPLNMVKVKGGYKKGNPSQQNVLETLLRGQVLGNDKKTRPRVKHLRKGKGKKS